MGYPAAQGWLASFHQRKWGNPDSQDCILGGVYTPNESSENDHTVVGEHPALTLKISHVYPDFIYLNLCRIFVQQTVDRSNVSPCSGRYVSACFDSLQGVAVQEEQQPSLL